MCSSSQIAAPAFDSGFAGLFPETLGILKEHGSVGRKTTLPSSPAPTGVSPTPTFGIGNMVSSYTQRMPWCGIQQNRVALFHGRKLGVHTVSEVVRRRDQAGTQAVACGSQRWAEQEGG